MERLFIPFLVVAAAASAVVAQEGKPDKQPATPEAADLRRVEADHSEAQRKFFDAYRKATTDEERQKLFSELYPQPEPFAKRALQIATDHPDSPTAVDALVLAIGLDVNGESGQQALKMAADKFVASPQMATVCLQLMYTPTPATKAFLNAVLEKNGDPKARGTACYVLARQTAMNEATKADAEKMFERVVNEFGNVPLSNGTLGKMAEHDLFEIRNLAIGKVAPEISGGDLDGQTFKLSDYRGKVVVLDFWGNW